MMDVDLATTLNHSLFGALGIEILLSGLARYLTVVNGQIIGIMIVIPDGIGNSLAGFVDD